MISMIGEGGTAAVYKSFDKTKNEIVALKVMKFSSKNFYLYQTEVETLSNFESSYILKVLDNFQIDDFLVIVLRYVPSTLSAVIGKIAPEKAIKICRMIFIAIEHMHSRGFTHRDIKLSNILLGSKEIYLCDFGLCARGERTTFCGTEEYLAPEIRSRDRYSHKVDVFAAGLIFFILLTSRRLKDLREIDEEFENLPEIKNFLKNCLKDDQSKRISAIKALESDLFAPLIPKTVSYNKLKDFTKKTTYGIIEKKGNIVKFLDLEIEENGKKLNCGCFSEGKHKIFINGKQQSKILIEHKDLKKLDFVYNFLESIKSKTEEFKKITHEYKFTKKLNQNFSFENNEGYKIYKEMNEIKGYKNEAKITKIPKKIKMELKELLEESAKHNCSFNGYSLTRIPTYKTTSFFIHTGYFYYEGVWIIKKEKTCNFLIQSCRFEISDNIINLYDGNTGENITIKKDHIDLLNMCVIVFDKMLYNRNYMM